MQKFTVIYRELKGMWTFLEVEASDKLAAEEVARTYLNNEYGEGKYKIIKAIAEKEE